MNQKKCSQCKNLIPVTAPTCLYCGRPNKFITNNYVRRKWDKEYKKNKKINHRKILLLFIIVIIAILLINL